MKKLLILISLLCASAAFASEPVVCTLTTGTGAATSTTGGCTTGSVTWKNGSAVLMQCTTDVYVSSTTTQFGGTVTAATSSMELVDFTVNKDKVFIILNKNDLHISVLAATAAGSCKFMITQRKKPIF
jgi:hypothetical protein